jgi:hypothetical protein
MSGVASQKIYQDFFISCFGHGDPAERCTNDVRRMYEAGMCLELAPGGRFAASERLSGARWVLMPRNPSEGRKRLQTLLSLRPPAPPPSQPAEPPNGHIVPPGDPLEGPPLDPTVPLGLNQHAHSAAAVGKRVRAAKDVLKPTGRSVRARQKLPTDQRGQELAGNDRPM